MSILQIAKDSPNNKREEGLTDFLSKNPSLDFSNQEKEALKLIFDFIRDMRFSDREILTEIKEILHLSIKPQAQKDSNSNKFTSMSMNLIEAASKLKLNESKAHVSDYLLKKGDKEATLDELEEETSVHRSIISGFLRECRDSNLVETTMRPAKGRWKKMHNGKVNYYKFINDLEVRRVIRQKTDAKLSP